MESGAPLHRRPLVLLAVGLGGATGSALRHLVTVAVPSDGFPLATLLVNLTGCLLLGALVEALARTARPGTAAAICVRLGLGAGVLGSFTTYSAFALEVDQLLAADRPAAALAYVVASLVGGLLAVAAGVATARRWAPRARGKKA